MENHLDKLKKWSNMDQFNEWLDVFIEEKEINTEKVFDLCVNETWNYMPLSVVIEYIKQLPKKYKQITKNRLVKIDFINGDVYHFFKHLAKGIIQLEGLQL